MPALASVLLVLASLLSSISATMMLRGAVKAGTSAGLAVSMLALNLLTSPLWIAYALPTQNWAMLASSVLWSSVNAIWWGNWLRDRDRAFWPGPVVIAVWTAFVSVLALTVVPYAVFGWIAGFVGVGSSIPQLVHLIRTDRLGQGFHLRAWLISGGSITAWTAYGFAAGEPPIWVPDLIAMVILLSIVARSTFLHRRSTRIDRSIRVHPAFTTDPEATGQLAAVR